MYEYAKRGQKMNQKKAKRMGKTGIPRKLKQDMESSSGFSLEDVQVHYNSPRPARLHAYAYAQGNQVYLGPGQEKHLSHELGHVIQQKMGIVSANDRHSSGVQMNTDERLERQADQIGQAAGAYREPREAKASGAIVQRNPFQVNDNVGTDGMPLSAHHIIPRSLLEKAYRLLQREDKVGLYESAGAGIIGADGGGNHAEEEYLEWPQGNLFYGPHTKLRPEAGGKDGFDYDARFFLNSKIFLSLKKLYQDIFTIVSAAESSQASFSNEKKEELIALLKNFYQLTATEPLPQEESQEEPQRMLKDPVWYHPQEWEEVVDGSDLMKVIEKYRRVKKYMFYKFENPKNREVFAGLDMAPQTPQLVFARNSTQKKIQKAGIDLSKVKKVAYLPKKLVQYILAVDDVGKLRKDFIQIKNIELKGLQKLGTSLQETIEQFRREEGREVLCVSLQRVCEAIAGSGVGRIGGQGKLVLDNEKIEEHAETLLEECGRMQDIFNQIAQSMIQITEAAAQAREAAAAAESLGGKPEEFTGVMAQLESIIRIPGNIMPRLEIINVVIPRIMTIFDERTVPKDSEDD